MKKKMPCSITDGLQYDDVHEEHEIDLSEEWRQQEEDDRRRVSAEKKIADSINETMRNIFGGKK